jgi:glutathione S-transferase
MARPRLYGIPGSRALRSIWAIEEVGIDYEFVPTHFIRESKQPEYLAVNPNGKIPALVDGDLTLFESMAINLYLAKTYGGDLYPVAAADEALAWQWSVWGLTEIEPHLMAILLNRIMLPDDLREPEKVVQAEKSLVRPLSILDNRLADRSHLLGDRFSIADLNVASVLSMSTMIGFEGIAEHPHAAAWYQAATDRPSFTRAQQAGE